MPEGEDLSPWGYAPGNYAIDCADCGRQPFMDRPIASKKSFRCRQHALQARDRVDPLAAAIMETVADDPVMARARAGLGLTDAEYIELLWRCVTWGGELMPADVPDSELLRLWSKWQEAATVERQRRGASNEG